VTEIVQNSAICGGTIYADWSETVTERGICWSTSPDPKISDNKITSDAGLGKYSCTINGLAPSTTYFVKAYAINSNGISYGFEEAFKTLDIIPGLAQLLTTQVTNISTTSVTSGGTITSDGGNPVNARGVCWSTSQNPSLSGDHTDDGNGIGVFTSQVTGLTPYSTYYIKAYASNSAGTAYGNEITFFTSPDIVTDIDGNTYHPIEIGTQIWLKENLNVTRYSDGDQIQNVTDHALWFNLATGAYANYNNDENSAMIYGRLYNFFAAAGSKKICPDGWHVPSESDWNTLIIYLGGEAIAGGKMKATGTIENGDGLWLSPNSFASNASGFTGLPGGYRIITYDFASVGSLGNFWSSTEHRDSNYGKQVNLFYNNSMADLSYNTKQTGLSIRCIKD
jgi:uncharacterized protein (TIGR02145 family)